MLLLVPAGGLREEVRTVKSVTIERFAYTAMGTFGRMMIEECEMLWYTVENPWKDNLPRISCIPLGHYELELGTYHRGDYPAYEVLDVPGRSLVKFHVGNTHADVSGCIAVGLGLGYVAMLWAVTKSAKGFAGFMDAMGGEKEGHLWITNVVGG